MREKERLISLLIVVLLMISGFYLADLQKAHYKFPKIKEAANEISTDLSDKAIKIGPDFNSTEKRGSKGRTNYRNKELRIDESFISNLPLVVIDTGDMKPKRGVVWSQEKEYYIPTGEDPYAYGEIFIIDNDIQINKLTDPSSVHSKCKLKIRGNSSGNYDKKQYLLKLINNNGKSVKKSILDMGEDNEWILNISFIDKSLLRNYLAYTAAREIMPYTPDSRFCEVIWKDKDGYRYEGVYLLMESIKVGKNRVNLPQYSENSPVTPALIRRDRYNLNGIMLENYALKHSFTSGYLDIEYPDKDIITSKGIENITNRINEFEKVLYADSFEEFIKYRSFIDINSFVDYFLINEFFLNYDAGYHSTYMSMDYSGRISMGPVWDFDQAMDNNPFNTANLYTTAFHSAPWFDRILQDPVYTKLLIDRYKELRSGILSDESIKKFIKETVEYLGDAVDRDWARWGYYYTEGDFLEIDPSVGIERNSKSYEEEIIKLVDTLLTHGKWMDEHLDSLYQFKLMSLEDVLAEEKKNNDDINIREGLAVVFILVFLISVKLVLKYESE